MYNLVKDVLGIGKATATAGTVITALIPFKKKLKAWISTLKYTAAGTAHTVTVMQALGRTTLSADAASGQAVVPLAADPGTGTAAGAIAANDYVVVECDDESCFLSTVASAASLATVTLNANLTVKASKGRRVWFFGVASDGHPQYNAPASATTTLGGDQIAGLNGAKNREEPFLVQSNNATAAGTIEQVSAVYLDSGHNA